MKPRPDYQIHLKYRANHVDVYGLCERLASRNLHDQVRQVIATAGGGVIMRGSALTILTSCAFIVAINTLDQDGLQRAYFELNLLELGAMSTYERVKHQGIALSTPPALYTVSLYELEQLLNCASNDGYDSATIQSILKMAGHGLPPENQTLSRLDETGLEVVYKQVLRLLVNPIEFIRANPLDFHPSNLRDNDND